VKLRGSSVSEPTSRLERVAIVLVSLVLSIGVIALSSGFFASHDAANVSGAQVQPGQGLPDQGHAVLQPGELRPVYNSDPPTSGPHIPEPVLLDNTELNNDQLLQALELGDVVIMYGQPAPPPGLTAFARSLSAPFSPALARAGQAVILARRPRTVGLIGLAWRRMIRVQTPSDHRLHEFVQFWLGGGAAGGR
jgi:hypothetical protein